CLSINRDVNLDVLALADEFAFESRKLDNFGGETRCKVCMQTFMCTTTEVKCREHADAKHPKVDVYQCFPHLQK
ncbi:hypothetical protein EJ110_NYTH27413, partial [Nymphaea thermarum]